MSSIWSGPRWTRTTYLSRKAFARLNEVGRGASPLNVRARRAIAQGLPMYSQFV